MLGFGLEDSAFGLIMSSLNAGVKYENIQIRLINSFIRRNGYVRRLNDV